jgi:hypothetical protein
MKEMRIEDLLLYDSNKGKYLEGKLLVDAITPILGTTTIIEDSNNHVIPVVFYDFLLGGLNGEDAVAITLAKIPKGSRIRIAEPFMKVFRDITIISDISESVVNEDIALTNVKTQGNIMVKKKMYNAAIDVYITGIRKADLVPTLFSNESQTFASENDWERSLANAAGLVTKRHLAWCQRMIIL